MLKATVSGSFHRHMAPIYEAVGTLRSMGVTVLSPADPRIVDHDGEFLFVASDRLRSIKLVQDRHLAAIRQSDFLWVVCPDGYTGPSTSGEIMAASVLGVPVYSETSALDITIGQYVQRVPSMRVLVERLRQRAPRVKQFANVLLDPTGAIDASVRSLESLGRYLTVRSGDGKGDAERALSDTQKSIAQTLGRGRRD